MSGRERLRAWNDFMRIAASVLLMGIAACSKPQPKMSDAQVNDLRAALPGISEECLQILRMEGAETKQELTTERCFGMEPAKLWTGLWHDEFEGSDFCAVPARTCPDDESRNRVSLTFGPNALPNSPKAPGGLYAIEFVGRRSKNAGWYGKTPGYREMIVDKVISIKELEPPYEPATAKEMKASVERCRKDRQCLTDEEMKALRNR